MFFSDKTITYIGLESNEMIESQPTLEFTQMVLKFIVKFHHDEWINPDELVIHHFLHGFTEAAHQSHGAVVSRVSMVLSSFGVV